MFFTPPISSTFFTFFPESSEGVCINFFSFICSASPRCSGCCSSVNCVWFFLFGFFSFSDCVFLTILVRKSGMSSPSYPFTPLFFILRVNCWKSFCCFPPMFMLSLLFLPVDGSGVHGVPSVLSLLPRLTPLHTSGVPVLFHLEGVNRHEYVTFQVGLGAREFLRLFFYCLPFFPIF